MSYNKPTKYKILDMKNNQQLINDEMVIQKLPFRTEDPRPPKWFREFAEKQNNINLLLANQIKELQTTPPKWFKEFAEKQEKVNTIIFDFMEKQTKWFQEFEKRTNERFDRIETDIGDLKARMAKVENRIEGIDTTLKIVIRLNNLKTE